MTMRASVARAIDLYIDRERMWIGPYERGRVITGLTDAAITACLTALAAEAKEQDAVIVRPMMTGPSDNHIEDAEDWILSFLPSQPEVRDGAG